MPNIIQLLVTALGGIAILYLALMMTRSGIRLYYGKRAIAGVFRIGISIQFYIFGAFMLLTLFSF